ncbi:hypothetical protein [Dialister sp.]|uniref:hypothetical protein n=1 Tax=Dialister sp. TaxID=1955814 RepID=UPI002E80D063|nr:hypothetical protein [Dialister sp.]MEE3452836.1 hypothetical protein [Dialister sp.]
MVGSDFKKNVASGDVELVRLDIKNTIIPSYRQTHTFHELDEYLAYADSRISNLYDAHDGEIFPDNKTEWTSKLLVAEMVTLVDNFSHERLDFIKRICVYLYGGEKPLGGSHISKRKKAGNSRQKSSGCFPIVAGAFIAVSGAIMAKFPVIMAGIVVAVLGTALNSRE